MNVQIFRGLMSALVTLAVMSGFAQAADPVPRASINDALALWTKIHTVFSRPRCANCRVGSDYVPIWSGKNFGPTPRPHGMNINGGASRMGVENGLLCVSCHMPHNATLANGPPGATPWRIVA